MNLCPGCARTVSDSDEICPFWPARLQPPEPPRPPSPAFAAARRDRGDPDSPSALGGARARRRAAALRGAPDRAGGRGALVLALHVCAPSLAASGVEARGAGRWGGLRPSPPRPCETPAETAPRCLACPATRAGRALKRGSSRRR